MFPIPLEEGIDEVMLADRLRKVKGTGTFQKSYCLSKTFFNSDINHLIKPKSSRGLVNAFYVIGCKIISKTDEVGKNYQFWLKDLQERKIFGNIPRFVATLLLNYLLEYILREAN